jgi:hypothetical protein
MKLMANHSSVTTRGEAPHVNRTSRTNTIVNALKERALAVLNDSSIDSQSRAIVRYAMEINDPWLAELVRQAGSDGPIDLSEIPLDNDAESKEEKIKVLTDKICDAGEEPMAALLVLMSALDNATPPTALANIAKRRAFTRCVELNVYGVVDAQIVALEGELFAGDTLQH